MVRVSRRDSFLGLGDTSLDEDSLTLFLRVVGGDFLGLIHADLLRLVLAMFLGDLLLDLPWNCGAFSSWYGSAFLPGDIYTILVRHRAAVLPGNIFTLLPWDIPAQLVGNITAGIVWDILTHLMGDLLVNNLGNVLADVSGYSLAVVCIH